MLQETHPTTVIEQEREQVLDPLYKVILHNDDRNTMEHVMRSLIRVFGMDEDSAAAVMLMAHNEGSAVCTVEPLERAELHRDQLIALSLSSTIEPE